MRNAYLVLPTSDNDGEQTDSHAALQLVLADSFGGFTVTYGKGAWRDDSTSRAVYDSVAVYAIAMSDISENETKLESIARFYGHMTGQTCVMVTHARGDVVFVDSSANILESV